MQKPPLSTMLIRGLRRLCPQCGTRPVLHRYLKVVPACAHCDAPLGEIRADDFPPYITIVVVGHVVVPLLVLAERYLALPQWLHLTIWPLLAVVLMAVVLPTAKGLCVGLMWHLGLKGDETQSLDDD